MKMLSSDQCVYAMDRANRPVVSIEPGEELLVEMKDCYSDTVRTEDDTFKPEEWGRVNPATGPVKVVGAEPGDVLVVRILDLELAS